MKSPLKDVLGILFLQLDFKLQEVDKVAAQIQRELEQGEKDGLTEGDEYAVLRPAVEALRHKGDPEKAKAVVGL